MEGCLTKDLFWRAVEHLHGLVPVAASQLLCTGLHLVIGAKGRKRPIPRAALAAARSAGAS